ncbi:MAG: 6-carboxytetrahydropterin synthase [Dehalococcoidia bacterium]
MTNPPSSEEPRDDQPSHENHTCYNCFAEFSWEPTIHDGEEFCCAGCVEGGPCICTYEGTPKPVEDDLVPTAVVSEIVAVVEDDLELIAHREIILEAIEELPIQLQHISRLRVTNDGHLEDIAREAGIPVSEAAAMLHQAQALLGRSLGPEFVIEYIAAGVRAPLVITPPSVDEPVVEPIAEPEPPTAPTAAPASTTDDLSAAIQAPLEALTAPLLGTQDADGETAVAQSTIREALRDASAIFRLAAERLGEDPDEHPLRRLLADESSDEIRIIAEGLTEPALYLVALDGLDSTRWARIESKEETRTIFAVEAVSTSALIRDVMGLEHPFRPTRLVVRDNEIEIALPVEAGTGATVPPVVGEPAQLKTRPVFELGADAFFGARHFVTMGGVQGPPHHHSFRVEALMDAPAQDSDGVVLGFGDARRLVEEIVLDYNESLLNTIEPFTTIQPTSENIAKVIFERLKAQLNTNDIRLKQVRVWESPTNSASYSDAVLAI